MTHIPVLLHEAIDNLKIRDGDIFVDCTLGGGGHIEEVAKRFGHSVAMIGIDLDPLAIERVRGRLSHYNLNVRYVNENFGNIEKILSVLNIDKVDKILLDIGFSSYQIEESGKGFSFQKNEPLIMTFGRNTDSNQLTAKEIVNEWDEENIATILLSYGEEKFAKKIANKILESRKLKPIETTFDLVEIVKDATPKWYSTRKIHPATKTFQALRITVNDEIGNLRRCLTSSFEKLNSSGRIAVISFHSIEDRTVKNFFRDKKNQGLANIITKKPLVPDKNELKNNKKSRSAKLRILEKI